MPPSCTNPITQFIEANSDDLCPLPPSISGNDYLNNTDTTGRLDSDNTYVNEYLLRVAERMRAPIYSRRVQGGFTLSRTEPIFSVCGCSDILDSGNFSGDILSGLQQCSVNDTVVFSESDNGNTNVKCIDESAMEGMAIGSGSGSGSGSGISSADAEESSFRLDGINVGLLQRSVCSECNQSTYDRPISSLFGPELTPLVTATVWYNNNVSWSFLVHKRCLSII